MQLLEFSRIDGFPNLNQSDGITVLFCLSVWFRW